MSKPETAPDAILSQLMSPVEAWLSTLAMQNLSEHTIVAYRHALATLAQFLIAKRLKGLGQGTVAKLSAKAINWSMCDKRQLTAFVTKRLDEDGVSIASMQQTLSAIRAFYGWLIDTGQARINPATGYQLKRQSRPLPAIADADLVKQLLDQEIPEDPEQARLWVRDKAMFELAYGSGLRLSELVGLNVGDIRRHALPSQNPDSLSAQSAKPALAKPVDATGQVRVQGKGGKVRLVPVGKHAMRALQNYLPHRALWLETIENDEPDALFISEKLGKRLTPRAVQLRLKKAVARADIAQNLYPHLLRHCFASHVLSSSGDLRAVQEMLGHSDISTTQIYTHVDFAQLTRVYDNAHPSA